MHDFIGLLHSHRLKTGNNLREPLNLNPSAKYNTADSFCVCQSENTPYLATWLMTGAKLVGPYSWTLCRVWWYACRIPCIPEQCGFCGLPFCKDKQGTRALIRGQFHLNAGKFAMATSDAKTWHLRVSENAFANPLANVQEIGPRVEASPHYIT